MQICFVAIYTVFAQHFVNWKLSLAQKIDIKKFCIHPLFCVVEE